MGPEGLVRKSYAALDCAKDARPDLADGFEPTQLGMLFTLSRFNYTLSFRCNTASPDPTQAKNLNPQNDDNLPQLLPHEKPLH